MLNIDDTKNNIMKNEWALSVSFKHKSLVNDFNFN